MKERKDRGEDGMREEGCGGEERGGYKGKVSHRDMISDNIRNKSKSTELKCALLIDASYCR